ncbi:MAG: SDR family oxidoreductase [Prolixibacteraceae bacterium]|jgi:short-subunit dehydrogenase|nr:SDR family oxidoreductase [Prolixibacteraceae bacterium]
MNNYCLITGAASGIGYEFAKIYIQKSFNLVLIDLNLEKLKDIKNEFESSFKNKVVIMQKDLCLQNIANEIYDELKKEKIEIEVLINNAGFGSYGSFMEVSWEKQLNLIQLTVITTSHLIRLFLKDMLERNSGQILTVSSISAFMPGPIMAVYFSSKTYLLSFCQAIANEVSHTNIKISVLCPGMTQTNFQKTNGNNKPKFTMLRATAKHVAEYGVKSLEKGKVVAIPKFYNRVITSLPRVLSLSLTTKLSRKVNGNNR